MINEILKTNYIKFGIKAKSKEEAFNEISKFAFEQGVVNNVEGYVCGLKERESLDTTGFGYGIAIPHAKVEAVEKAALLVVKFDEEVEWEALDDKPVKMAFVIAMPASDTENNHLKVLSQLARKLMHDDFRDNLFNATNEDELQAVITA